MQLRMNIMFESILVLGMDTRYFLLISRRVKFNKLYDNCRALWNECAYDDQLNVLVFERKARIFLKFMGISGFICHWVYVIIALIVRLPPIEPNGPARRILPYR